MSALPTLTEQGIEATRMVKVSDGATGYYTYVGYFSKGDSTKCIIKRIAEPDANTTNIDYPYGQCDYSFNWDNRATYPYLPRKN